MHNLALCVEYSLNSIPLGRQKYHLATGVGHCKPSQQFWLHAVVLLVAVSIAEHVHGEPVKI